MVFVQYVYPAIIYSAVEGGYYAEFPDVEGAITQGETLFEVLEMAEDVLAGMLADWEKFKAGDLKYHMNNRIVPPTPMNKVTAVPDEFSTEAFVTLIKVDTEEYLKKEKVA